MRKLIVYCAVAIVVGVIGYFAFLGYLLTAALMSGHLSP